MKRIKVVFTTVMIVFAHLTLMGQFGFVGAERQWNVYASGGFGSWNTEIYRLSDDTLIEGQLYRQIQVSYDSLQSWNLSGFVREEEEQVWFIPLGGGQKVILYDGSLRLGDTAHISSQLCSGQEVRVVITDYDTVLINGTPRRQWQLECTDIHFSDTWIEGIGSLYGPLNGIYGCCIICPFWELLCHYCGDTLVYQLPGSTGCFLKNIGIAHFDSEEPVINLLPNPVLQGNTFEVQASAEIDQITLYSIDGSFVKTWHPVNGTQILINTTGLSAEIYVLRIITRDGKAIRRKLAVGS
jgi:hypothetical protein